MSYRNSVRSAATGLLEAAAASQDALDPSVAASADSLRRRLSAWKGDGFPANGIEAVLGASDSLLDALHEVNPEGLPHPLKDPAAEVLSVIDMAENEGYSIPGAAAPRP